MRKRPRFPSIPVRLLAALVGPIAAFGEVCAEPAAFVGQYSDISRKRCTGGRAKGDHEPVVDRCRVLGGWEARTTYRGTSIAFALGGERLGAGYGVGEAIEWRGTRAGGRFAPRAAIVRLLSRDPSGRIVSALAILRVEGSRACKAAFLDGRDPAANARAREAADRVGANFRCGRDQAQVVGAETATVREMVDRSR